MSLFKDLSSLKAGLKKLASNEQVAEILHNLVPSQSQNQSQNQNQNSPGTPPTPAPAAATSPSLATSTTSSSPAPALPPRLPSGPPPPPLSSTSSTRPVSAPTPTPPPSEIAKPNYSSDATNILSQKPTVDGFGMPYLTAEEAKTLTFQQFVKRSVDAAHRIAADPNLKVELMDQYVQRLTEFPPQSTYDVKKITGVIYGAARMSGRGADDVTLDWMYWLTEQTTLALPDPALIASQLEQQQQQQQTQQPQQTQAQAQAQTSSTAIGISGYGIKPNAGGGVKFADDVTGGEDDDDVDKKSKKNNNRLSLPSKTLRRKHRRQGLTISADIDTLFFPDETSFMQLVSLIDCAVETVELAIFTLTDNDMANALIRAHRRGVAVRIIADNEQINALGSDIVRLRDEVGVAVKLDKDEYLMHHKFMVTDRAIVATGSYNYTRAARFQNKENVVIIRDAKVASKFMDAFEEMWEEYD
ncbi:phospholipase D/nuclease [Ramicandelaber brevisporus]|nr:phospholipase D/nuclease [Ramicandelaber brevisporus]